MISKNQRILTAFVQKSADPGPSPKEQFVSAWTKRQKELEIPMEARITQAKADGYNVCIQVLKKAKDIPAAVSALTAIKADIYDNPDKRGGSWEVQRHTSAVINSCIRQLKQQ